MEAFHSMSFSIQLLCKDRWEVFSRQQLYCECPADEMIVDHGMVGHCPAWIIICITDDKGATYWAHDVVATLNQRQ